MGHKLSEYQDKTQQVGVVGLGYVGLPLALSFAKHFRVVAFDLSAAKVEAYRQGYDPAGEVDPQAFHGLDITYTSSIEDLKQASFYVVAVPTPIDSHNKPDLTALLAASRTVGQVLKPRDTVVYESTVYPGCTEQDCVPVLEQESGLRCPADFQVGYSPERINPGDKEHTFERIVKVTAGIDQESAALVTGVYGEVVTAGTFQAASIMVAEAAKVIENTQRDLNIALMNELSLIFGKLGINTADVLAAAGTKWNFLPFKPGFVGGHCIGVDPYYLTYKATEVGVDPQVILAGRSINDAMASRVARQLLQHVLHLDKAAKEARVLVMGITFKENVSDIRNSKVADVAKELIDLGLQVDIVDPRAKPEEVEAEYGLELAERASGQYDVVLYAVSHEEFEALDDDYFTSHLAANGMLFDAKSQRRSLRNKVANYASL